MIELPSGKIIDIEIPSGVSKDEVKAKLIRNGLATEDDFVSPQQERSAAEVAGGALEAAATIGSSMIAEPVAGIAGIAGISGKDT